MQHTHSLPYLPNLSWLVPALLQGDAQVRLLRNEEHGDEKNDRMMKILNSKDWWLEYKQKLDARRALDEARWEAGLPPSDDPYPKHPSKRVEKIERLVDQEMRKKYPDYTR